MEDRRKFVEKKEFNHFCSVWENIVDFLLKNGRCEMLASVKLDA
jgi:hypothetical protein